MEENPFPDLKINSADFLDSLEGRSKCSVCHKSRKYYCYTCFVPVAEIADRIPQVKLPIKIDIIKHPGEVDGKSTAAHAAVLSSQDVTIYTYPCIPEYKNKDKVIMVFPGESAISLQQLASKLCRNPDSQCCKKITQQMMSITKRKREADDKVSKVDNKVDNDLDDMTPESCNDETKHLSSSKENHVQKNGSYSNRTLDMEQVTDCISRDTVKPQNCMDSDMNLERVVFLDSTWNQTRTICMDERLKGIQCVELKMHKTKFWRHQKDVPDTYLSTIEAIYYFLCDFHEHFLQLPYVGEYDNLLFFFTYMYKKIRNLYDGGDKLEAYKKRKEEK